MCFDLRTVVFSRRERQLLWKCTSDALTALLVPLKSSSPLVGPRRHRHKQQSPAGACSETDAPAFCGACGAGAALAVLPLGGRDVPGSCPALPHRRDRVLAGSVLPHTKQAPPGIDTAFRGETLNPECSIKSKIFIPKKKHMDLSAAQQDVEQNKRPQKHPEWQHRCQCSTVRNTPFALLSKNTDYYWDSN